MLIIFLRAIILFFTLLVVIRLMGKRQIGEMEPFELVITLVIAELACIPMADRSIPLTFGVVAIFTMFVIHQFIVLFSGSAKIQKLISGRAIVVIDKNGINAAAMKKLSLHASDVLQSLRSAGYFSVEEIDYGLMETNGQLSVIPRKSAEERQQTLAVPVILDGKWSDEDITEHNINKDGVREILLQRRLRAKQLLLLTVDENNRVLLQPYDKPYSAFIFKGGRLLES